MTTFTAPLKIKGTDSENRTGTVVAVQRATLAAVNSAGNPVTFDLPPGSNIINYFVDVEQPFAAGALVTAARVNVQVGGSLLTEVGVSASGRYDVMGGTSAIALARNVTATVAAFASTKALASALTAGQAMLSITYITE